MKRLVSILLCLAFLLALPACKRGGGGKPGADKTITYHLSADPKTLDPQIAADFPSIVAIEALFEGLVRLDSAGAPYPGVAKSWESNANDTEFTFHLRSDAVWVGFTKDKTKPAVTAQDFVYAFRRALTPSTGSATNEAMLCIQNAEEVRSGALAPEQLGVSAPDDHTLVVKLSYSYKEFPALTATAPFMPCHQEFFESTNGRYGLERKYLMVNGPFVIDGAFGWDHGKSMKLRRNPAYHGKAVPLPAALSFSMGKSAEVSDPLTALTGGTTDVIALPAAQKSSAEQAGCQITAFEDTTWGLCFNTQGDQMKNETLRRAFLLALDREAVLTKLPAGMVRADDILPPATSFLGNSYRAQAGSGLYLKQNDASENPNALLDQALAQLGLGSDSYKPAEVLCLDSEPVKQVVNEMIIFWNRSFNRNFNMKPLSQKELDSRIQSGNYELALTALQPTGSSPLNALKLFTSEAQGNPARLASGEYDALITGAEQEDGAAALPNLTAAEQYLNEHAVFYPLYYESHYYAAAKGVTGVIIHPYQGGIDFIQAGKTA